MGAELAQAGDLGTGVECQMKPTDAPHAHWEDMALGLASTSNMRPASIACSESLVLKKEKEPKALDAQSARSENGALVKPKRVKTRVVLPVRQASMGMDVRLKQWAAVSARQVATLRQLLHHAHYACLGSVVPAKAKPTTLTVAKSARMESMPQQEMAPAHAAPWAQKAQALNKQMSSQVVHCVRVVTMRCQGLQNVRCALLEKLPRQDRKFVTDVQEGSLLGTVHTAAAPALTVNMDWDGKRELKRRVVKHVQMAGTELAKGKSSEMMAARIALLVDMELVWVQFLRTLPTALHVHFTILV